ncbi:ABC transporter ATP-binding protein [filamentous cyanobacterium CCP3]|nr:ABC transporter ATP-binding protein [filamentous cyanobacterium CCP3]
MTYKKQHSNSITKDLYRLYSHLSPIRRLQLSLLLLLLILAALSEMVSLGLIVPFLSALVNAQVLLEEPRLQFMWSLLGVQTSIQLVTVLAIIFIVTAVAANTLRICASRLQSRFTAIIGTDISSQIYYLFIKQPYIFHVRQNSSDLIQILVDDTNRLTSFVVSQSLQFVSQVLLVSALIMTLLTINGKIALGAAVILGSAYFLIYRIRRSALKRNGIIIAEAGARKVKVVQEGIGGIRDVLLGDSQVFFHEAYLHSEKAYRHATAMNSFFAESPRYFIEALALSAIALLGLVLGQEGDFSQAIPILGSLGLGAQKMLPALQKVFSAIANIQGSHSSLSRILVALEHPVDPLSASVPAPLTLRNELRLEQIWFRYTEDTDWVLQDLSLTISAKSTTAFVGGTGSGKSTTADLIMGLLQPQKGKLCVDGIPLEGKQLRQWQKGITHVPQHIFLRDSTLAENIAFGVPKAKIDYTQVRRAARLAQIEDFIESLAASYDTYVGERGIRLSGGQRQRIGIARALYRKEVSTIVFDEATSALDNVTERELMAAIQQLSSEFTIILIAHRLSTVERCDLVVELDKGRIVAQGSYRELLEKSSSFRQMAGIL